MKAWIAAIGIGLMAVTAVAQEREPMHFSKLIEFLPKTDTIAGFEAGKPEGSTTSGMGMKATVVSVNLTSKDDSEKTIKVQITDGAPTQFVTMAYSMLGKFSQESTEGYEKAVEVDGYQAIEKYRIEEKDGTLTAVVNTLVVQIDTRGLPPETLQSTFKALNPKSLPAPAAAAAP